VSEPVTFTAPPGLVALTSPGSFRIETTMCLLAAAKASEKVGLALDYQAFGGSLVDKARNDACRHALKGPYGYVLFVDGDMTFHPESLLRLAHNAFALRPHFDVMGGLCHLRGGCIPTIDTGTGTWESHFAGSGTLEVIRTGAAFLLVKRHVLEKMPQPWFACRFPQRWLDALYEVDNFARTKRHGVNPFRELPGRPWEELMALAANDQQSVSSSPPGYEVGEDSGFCDRAKALGFRIAVDTDIEIGHLDVTVLNSGEHRKRMDEREKEARLLHGVLV